MDYIVQNLPEESRFETTVEGKTAYLDYHLSDGVIILLYAYTPVELRGKGIAGGVVKFALDYSRANKLKVIPQCPYTHYYIQRHPEYQDLMVG